MKTPEKIKHGLECCASLGACVSDKCEYYLGGNLMCTRDLAHDALEYINGLEVKVPRWINVKDGLPKKSGKYIVCTVKGSVYCTSAVMRGDEACFKCDINTHITHWMPLPEAPKEEE